MGFRRIFIHALLLYCAIALAGCGHTATTNAGSVPETALTDDGLRPFLKYRETLLAFTNASIIDGTGSPIKEKQTLIIEHGIIKAMGPGPQLDVPEGAKVIDLSGKTVVPGIVGMHNHLHIPQFPDVGKIAAQLYLAAGVTTIQTCGAASPYTELELSISIARGNEIGPEVVPSAPFITGKGGNPNMVVPRDEAHLRDTMRYWMDRGIEWFKVYRNISPENLKIVIDEAHKNKAKVRGHLCSVTFMEASKWGIDGIEHGLNSAGDFRTDKVFGICGGGREYMDEIMVDDPEVKKLHEVMIENKVVLTSTLSIFEASIPNRAYADDRSLRAMSPYLKRQYHERREAMDGQVDDRTRNDRLKRIMQFEYAYFQMGGLLCAGVDAGRHVLPGFGDQRNFELLIEAGFSTEEAIQIMTGNGARALGRTDIGTIREGNRADLVILEGDLDANPTVIKNVETVFKNGIGYDPEKILGQLEGKFGME